MRVVADTGGLYALLDVADRHHAPTVALFERNNPSLIIPSTILTEVDYLVRRRLGIDAELSVLDDVFAGAFHLENLQQADLARSRELIEQYRDLDLGLADASVVAVAERLGIQRILTVDHRDFRAIRPATGRTLSLLPADASSSS